MPGGIEVLVNYTIFELVGVRELVACIDQAAADHGIDLRQSWFIGDILNDVEAGRKAGCRTILIDNGNETEWVLTPDRVPHHTAPNLDLAADYILQAHPPHSDTPSHDYSRRSNQTVA